jgi:hypothetical protein
MSHPIASRSRLLIFLATFNLFQLLATAFPILGFMAEEPSHDPIVSSLSTDEDTGKDFGVESITTTASSLTRGVTLMAKGEIPELSDFF